MIRRPPRSTRTDTLLPYTTLFRSEMAAKQQLVDRHGLGRGANPPATDLAKGLGEGRGIGGDARRGLLVEDPRRTMRIEATGRDLVEHVGEARRIGRVRAAPPQLANGETQRIVERSEEPTYELQSLMRSPYAVFC